MSASADSAGGEVNSEDSRKLKHDFARELLEKSKEEMQDPEKLEIASNHMLNSLLDNVIFGVVLEVYFDFESGKLVALEGEEDEPMNKLTTTPDTTIFGDKNNKKPIDCHCPNCQTKVAASRFAPHLEKCMGMGRNSSRIASRRIANARENINTLSLHSDDDDDMEWAGEKRRKKIGSRNNNGSKKNGKN